jgi:SAM-dependent methyltransferase
MGIIKSNVKVLLDAKARGVDFSNMATLGHLRWYVTKKELRKAASHYRLDISRIEDPLGSAKYSDIFFHEVLGAKKLTTIDNSSYQGASVAHDLNLPIPESLERSFDAVVDSGTLEHVFNFPVALANVMKMVKVGGTLFLCVPANNYLGHGFYQFSPELFFRAFQEENGFTMTRILLVRHPYPGAELSSRQELYEAIDPQKVGQRASLVGSFPALLLIEAKRVADVPIFAAYPQQSDYAKIWRAFDEKNSLKHEAGRTGLRQALKAALRRLPLWAQNFAWGRYQKMAYSIRNKKFFRKIENI